MTNKDCSITAAATISNGVACIMFMCIRACSHTRICTLQTMSSPPALPPPSSYLRPTRHAFAVSLLCWLLLLQAAAAISNGEACICSLSLSRVSSLYLSIFLSLDLDRDLLIYLSPGGVKQFDGRIVPLSLRFYFYLQTFCQCRLVVM